VGPESGEAILIRGGVPVVGKGLIRVRRGRTIAERHLCDGPGKLCQALAVTRDDDGHDLCDPESRIYVADDGFEVEMEAVHRGPRVGVGYAGEAATWPLRFLYKQFTK
jgi:DNA-3-methyladenine glycosylase